MYGNDKYVTPILVNGIGDIDKSLKILDKTCDILNMAGVKNNNPILFSPVDFEHYRIQHVKINYLTYAEYNNFIINLGMLWKDDSHALICQNDGYPIHSENWTNEIEVKCLFEESMSWLGIAEIIRKSYNSDSQIYDQTSHSIAIPEYRYFSSDTLNISNRYSLMSLNGAIEMGLF